MTDPDVRSLHRQAVAGGPHEEAACLRARVRLGGLCKAQVGLAAYLGDEGARRLTACPEDIRSPSQDISWGGAQTYVLRWRGIDRLLLAEWLSGLQCMARKWITGERCGLCEGKGTCTLIVEHSCSCATASMPPCSFCENGAVEGEYDEIRTQCPPCKGTGKVPATTAEEPVMLRAAMAAARAALPEWEREHGRWHPDEEPCLAIEDAQRYIDDPTAENRDACDVAMSQLDDAPHPPMLIGIRHMLSACWDLDVVKDAVFAIREFANIAGEPVVRQAIQGLVPWILGEPRGRWYPWLMKKSAR